MSLVEDLSYSEDPNQWKDIMTKHEWVMIALGIMTLIWLWSTLFVTIKFKFSLPISNVV